MLSLSSKRISRLCIWRSFIVHVKALIGGEILAIFHVLLLKHVWFDDTGDFYLDSCCSAVNLGCSEAIVNFST